MRPILPILLIPLMLSACAAPHRSTALTLDDLETTTTEMAAKLQSSDFLKQRAADSPLILVAIDKVENLTSDIIPESDEWWMMARVRDNLNVNALRRDRNIAFVIPAAQLAKARRQGTLPADAAQQRRPTHEMSATFRSLARTAGKDRTDHYMCEYRITSLSNGQLEWTDSFEFKRTAFGKSYD